MANGALRVLCVHGVNTQDFDTAWQVAWRQAIQAGVGRWNPRRSVETSFLAYNDLFAQAPITPQGLAEALLKLGWSGLAHGITDRPRERGLLDLPDVLRWTAGMVAQWAENERLRAALRRRVLEAMRAHTPDVVLAHSLGSLMCYDTFVRKASAPAITDRTFVSFGSQIGNPFVRNVFGGRLMPLAGGFWYHLYNEHDDAFTAPIRMTGAPFEQVEAPFDIQAFLDHDAVSYLTQPIVVNTLWRALAGGPRARALGRSLRAFDRVTRRVGRVTRRGLLVGINDYPNPADRLEGCVNDVFLMSSVLQECGFSAEDIRVVLDDRATAKGVLERLGWLLEGVGPGDERVFYYSGHGAQIPNYGPALETDHYDECLVTHDFAWTPDTGLTDDRFYDLYSQLPYEARFVAIFDCCHSGGMTRDGGARVRGLNPPDDIRHRELRWDPKHEMWFRRQLPSLAPDLGDAEQMRAYLGGTGAARKLGRAMPLRGLGSRNYDRARRDLGHLGPYLPMILEACRENEYAYEYRHGVTSYGAFTFALAQNLRGAARRGRPPSFEVLLRQTGRTLTELKYDQHPMLVGPKAVLQSAVPWQEGGRRRPGRAASRRRRN
jgi:hypothetical protein